MGKTKFKKNCFIEDPPFLHFWYLYTKNTFKYSTMIFSRLKSLKALFREPLQIYCIFIFFVVLRNYRLCSDQVELDITVHNSENYLVMGRQFERILQNDGTVVLMDITELWDVI